MRDYIVAHAEELATSSGFGEIRLYTNQRFAENIELYRRLGYREVGVTVDSWPVSGGRTYVTVNALLERDLRDASQ